MIALAKASSNCKRHTHPLAIEDVKDYKRKGSVEKEKSLVVSLKGLCAKTN
jgi:hypothetical protein